MEEGKIEKNITPQNYYAYAKDGIRLEFSLKTNDEEKSAKIFLELLKVAQEDIETRLKQKENGGAF